MEGEDRILAACTRRTFGPAHRALVVREAARQPICWERVHTLAERHAVAPLVLVNLRQCGPERLALPRHVVERFEQSLFRTLLIKEQMAEMTRAALHALGGRGVQTLLVKGAALDLLVYEQPWHTSAEDVDLVLRLPAGPDAPTRAEVDGSLSRLALAWGHVEHRNLLEWDYEAHHDLTMNGLLPVDFAALWASARQLCFRGEPVYLLSPESMLLAVCINGCRKRFFRLKSLCDIAETIHRWPQLDWDLVARHARGYRCAAIVYSALTVTRALLGCACPSGIATFLGLSPSRAAMIRTTTRLLLRHLSLSTLTTEVGPTLRGRRMTAALLLPYLSYEPQQLWQKVARPAT